MKETELFRTGFQKKVQKREVEMHLFLIKKTNNYREILSLRQYNTIRKRFR